MSTSRDNDPNKPVTGYPYPPAQSSYHHPNGYPPPQQQQQQPPPPQANYHQSTAGTGYPYTAPPPATYYNPNPYPAPTYDPRRAAFLRRMIIAMISVFILFGAITFIFWLIFRPQVPQFRLDSASVSGFNASSGQLTGNWDVTFFVRNPNKKMTAVYSQLEGLVYYRRDLLSQTVIAPFVQDTKSETTLKAKMGASGTYLGDDLVRRMTGERSNGGAVQFHFRLGGWVRFRSSTWRTRSHFMRVFCDDVNIRFSSANSSNGTMVGGPKRCDVDL